MFSKSTGRYIYPPKVKKKKKIHRYNLAHKKNLKILDQMSFKADQDFQRYLKLPIFFFFFFFFWLKLVTYLNYSGIIPEFKKRNLEYFCSVKTVSNSTNLWISGLFLFLAASCSIPFFRYLVKRSFSVIAEDPK